MLYVIFGSLDARDGIYRLIQSLRRKKEMSDYIHIDAESEEDPVSHINSIGLFGQKTIIFLDNVQDKKKIQDNVKQYIESPNVFFLFETKLSKKFLNIVMSLGGIVEQHKEEKKEQSQTFIFNITKPLLEKKPEATFKIFHQLLNKGFTFEEIFGIIAWQLKVLLLTHTTQNAEEAGMSSYPYNKTKMYNKHFDMNAVIRAFDIANQSFGNIQTGSNKEKLLRSEYVLLNILFRICPQQTFVESSYIYSRLRK